jgi:hypothetical protein
MLLNHYLRDLAKFRAETQSLFDEMETTVKNSRKEAKARIEKMMKKIDAVGFVVEGILGLGGLVKTAASSLKKTGKALAEANRTFGKEVAVGTYKNVSGLTGIVASPENPAIELALNWFSFTYWGKKAGLCVASVGFNAHPDDIDRMYLKMLAELKRDRIRALEIIDEDIKIASSHLRFASRGIDPSTVA